MQYVLGVHLHNAQYNLRNPFQNLVRIDGFTALFAFVDEVCKIASFSQLHDDLNLILVHVGFV